MPITKPKEKIRAQSKTKPTANKSKTDSQRAFASFDQSFITNLAINSIATKEDVNNAKNELKEENRRLEKKIDDGLHGLDNKINLLAVDVRTNNRWIMGLMIGSILTIGIPILLKVFNIF